MRNFFSFGHVLALAIAIRVALILYSDWHDAHSAVKYTDVDYRVFTDAAKFLASPTNASLAKGPWGIFSCLGDPYERETYRYTPLLALILTPNEWLHPSFGKYLFAACDIINGIIMNAILRDHVLSSLATSADRIQSATSYTCLYLLNPLVFSISTRGSSESVLSLFVLATLYYALAGKWKKSAIMLGISAHWKIYPIIYGVGTLGVVGGRYLKKPASRWKALVSPQAIEFTLLSGSVFFLLGAFCYAIWGYPFLYESYLYHLHRLDHRHNFSPYFYLTYLTYPTSELSGVLSPFQQFLRSPLTSFVPQMGLTLGAGVLFGTQSKHLVFTWFVQTVTFVTFNKVCTSQYFLWYLLLLPLLLPCLKISYGAAIWLIGIWVGTQAMWLSGGYSLEFLGRDVFLGLWARSLLFMVGNVSVLHELMLAYS